MEIKTKNRKVRITMLTKELNLELIEFIIRKASPQLPPALLPTFKKEVLRQLERIVEIDLTEEFCLSLYYGAIFNALPTLPTITLPAKANEGSELNWLVSMKFFKMLLNTHQERLIQSSIIREALTVLNLSSFNELSSSDFNLLFKAFNHYLIENFTSPLTLDDFIQFTEGQLEESIPALTEEKPQVPDQEDSTLKPLTLEILQAELDTFLAELSPKIVEAMSHDAMFQACDYPKDYFTWFLCEQLKLRKWLISHVEADSNYRRDDDGNFVKNERVMIWNHLNTLYNMPEIDPEILQRLFTLMKESEAGFDYYQADFLKEFKRMAQETTVDPVFKTRVKEILSHLSCLKLEDEFNSL